MKYLYYICNISSHGHKNLGLNLTNANQKTVRTIFLRNTAYIMSILSNFYQSLMQDTQNYTIPKNHK